MTLWLFIGDPTAIFVVLCQKRHKIPHPSNHGGAPGPPRLPPRIQRWIIPMSAQSLQQSVLQTCHLTHAKLKEEF
ncbi:hypothetical protein FKM82_004550 [Ascaphus truei]